MLAERNGITVAEPLPFVGVTVAIASIPTEPLGSSTSDESTIPSTPITFGDTTGFATAAGLTSFSMSALPSLIPSDSASLQLITHSISIEPLFSIDSPLPSFSFPSLSSPSESTSVPTLRAGASAGASARASASGDNSHETSLGGLSPSSLIGIGIGVGLAGVIIILLGFIIVRLVRRTRRLRAQLETGKGKEPGIAMMEAEQITTEPGTAVMNSWARRT